MKKDTSWKNFRSEYMYLSFLLTFAEIGRLYIIERQVLSFFFLIWNTDKTKFQF